MITEITEQAVTAKIGERTVLSRLGEKTSLGPISALLDRLNHPECNFPSIHVGGTSGKGSTTNFLTAILTAAGLKTGMFTKPHLQTVRERFVIDHACISPAAILALIERMPLDLETKPTWFELITAMAFQHFSDQQVDFGVIEVGLGGSLDATNVITPELSIITNVGLDHTDVLGSTVEEIAADKAGIIKSGKPVISGVTQPRVINIVKERCASQKSPLRLLGQDFFYSVIALEAGGSVFDFEMDNITIRDISLRMPGRHQVINACAAIAAALELRKTGVDIPTTAIQEGLAQTIIPGRLEIIQYSPTLILDGAHSPPKMEALAQSLRTLFTQKRRTIGILACSKGHDAHNTLAHIAPLLDAAVLTEFSAETDYGNKRAQAVDQLAGMLRQLNPGLPLTLEPDPILAVQTAQRMAAGNDLICVTGSIFLVGQIREYLTSIDGDSNVSNS